MSVAANLADYLLCAGLVPRGVNITTDKRSSECLLVFYRGSGSKSRPKKGFHYCLTSETVTDTVTFSGGWGQVGKWISISECGGEHSRLSPMGSGEEFASLTCLGHIPCIFLCSSLFNVISLLRKKNPELHTVWQKSTFYPFSLQNGWWAKHCLHKAFPFLMESS